MEFFQFYIKYQQHFMNILLFSSILFCLLIGIMGMNTFNRKNEKDLTGKQLFIAMLFLSFVIYNGMISWANKYFIHLTSLAIGFGATDILTKWRKIKIWNFFDFISKGRGGRK